MTSVRHFRNDFETQRELLTAMTVGGGLHIRGIFRLRFRPFHEALVGA